MDDWGEVKSQNGGGGLLGKSAGRGKTMRAAVDLDAQVGAMSISGSNGVDDEWGGGPAIAARAPAVVDDEWGGGQAVAPKAAVVDDEWGGGSEAAVATSGAAGGDWLEESAPRGGGFVQNGGGINGGGGFGQNGGRMNGGSDRACFKCKQEGHQSRDCPNGGGGGSRACYKCNEEGHMSRDCPNGDSRKCNKCGEGGHMARECPSGGGGGNGDRGCRKCGEEGHFARECPSGGGGEGDRLCRRCQDPGHQVRDCPQPVKCYNCQEEGHQSKDCTNPPKAGEDGKIRERYIPSEDGEDEIFKSAIGAGINFDTFDAVPLQLTGDNCPEHALTFEGTGLRQLLLDNVRRSGYTKPTPVQKGSIPVILARRDLIACAQTGSGKTAAYLLPVLHVLLEQGVAAAPSEECQAPQVVVVAPTRELAIQIQAEVRKFAVNSVLKSVIAYGGTVMSHQVSRLQQGCNILVATPGRLKHFVELGHVTFSSVQFLILDEADRMLDMGFGPDVEMIAGHASMVPVGKRQTLMFSATFPVEVQNVARKYMNDYIFVTTGVLGGTNTDVNQEFIEVSRREKRGKLLELLEELGKVKTIVFCDSKKTADFLSASLSSSGIDATSIHGDRLQSQREQALREFRQGKRHVLVATNVAARGLDIAGVEYVINYDLPKDVEEYVHRIGRTGRVGNLGKSISFYDANQDEQNAPKLVEKLVQSGAEVPSFLQASAGGVAGMAYNYNAPSSTTFASRDMRAFGGGGGGVSTGGAEQEAEESWD